LKKVANVKCKQFLNHKSFHVRFVQQQVTRSITYIDPRDVSSYMDAPGDLLTQDGRAMRSYGMFDMDFRNSANRELDVRNVSTVLLRMQRVQIWRCSGEKLFCCFGKKWRAKHKIFGAGAHL